MSGWNKNLSFFSSMESSKTVIKCLWAIIPNLSICSNLPKKVNHWIIPYFLWVVFPSILIFWDMCYTIFMEELRSITACSTLKILYCDMNLIFHTLSLHLGWFSLEVFSGTMVFIFQWLCTTTPTWLLIFYIIGYVKLIFLGGSEGNKSVEARWVLSCHKWNLSIKIYSKWILQLSFYQLLPLLTRQRKVS